MATATQRAEDADAKAGMGEVTIAQKMLSAVSGSVLTSLLGMSIILQYSFQLQTVAAAVDMFMFPSPHLRRCASYIVLTLTIL